MTTPAARPDINEIVRKTTFVDTHEHILEEKTRLETGPGSGLFPCDDWAYILYHYTGSDLDSAGMPQEDSKRFFSKDVDPDEKWALVAPYWDRVKHTGYGQAAQYSIAALYGIDDLNEKTYQNVHERYKARLKPGYYEPILRDIAGIESCQVNSLETICMRSGYPALLMQDISFIHFSDSIARDQMSEESGLPGETLQEFKAMIDWYFETYGQTAVAIKSQAAYGRRLNYQDADEQTAASVYSKKFQKKAEVSPEEWKSLQDHLFWYCLDRAVDHNLPVKLHTGYYAGSRGMPLDRVRRNAGDLCPVLKRYPEAKFVLMHIDYPYQHEAVALAKHYPNAWIDMCWAWIISPIASKRFLKEILITAPSNKVLTFGADYCGVENVPGHAEIARRGIAQVITELIHEGWLPQSEAPALIKRIMHGTARELFNLEEKTRILTQAK